MPSRADGRRALEWVLRIALVAGLAFALRRSLAAPAHGAVSRGTDVRGLRTALVEATRSARVRALHVTADSAMDGASRHWLRALRRAGVAVTWRAGPPPLAVQVERAPAPASRARIALASDSGQAVSLSDSAGALDSLRGAAAGTSLEVTDAVRWVRVRAGRFAAQAPVPEPDAPRAVLVLGRAGWEARFVATALHEAGWTVRRREPAAPGVVVADAGVLPVDTARYAAVVALDSTARDLAPALVRFAATGGGLVLAGSAAMLPYVSEVTPARVAAREPGRILLDADNVTRADLPLRPLVQVRGDAVRLENVGTRTMLAVRRAGLGRVLVVGYDDSWRWRMLGGADGMASHRAWWSHAVALVAPAAAGTGGSADAAPRAAMVDALGPPSSVEPRRDGPAAREPLPLALLALLLALLLAETASRRFRGAS